jgi:hypothetical protein
LAESTPELMLRSARIDADACRALAAVPWLCDPAVAARYGLVVDGALARVDDLLGWASAQIGVQL